MKHERNLRTLRAVLSSTSIPIWFGFEQPAPEQPFDHETEDADVIALKALELPIM